MKGKVKFYNEKKGFGFITGENELDYFFHYTNILNNAQVTKDDKVTFNEEQTDKGLQAKNIIKAKEEYE